MPMHFDARRDELIRTILESSRLPGFLFHFPSSTRAPSEFAAIRDLHPIDFRRRGRAPPTHPLNRSKSMC
jgi:hypothetical protein